MRSTCEFGEENKVFLCIDVGTSVCKVVLFDQEFNEVYKVSGEIQTFHPKPHWFEQDPNQWWKLIIKLIRKIPSQYSDRIIGVGICAQAHAPILVNGENQALHPCLSWPDLRAIKEAEFLSETLKVRILPFESAASKLLWIKKNHPRIFERTYKILFPKDFVRTKFTDDFCTDPTDAILSGLYDRERREWNRRLLDLIGVPPEKLPPIHPSHEIIGKISKKASEETGLHESIPVIMGAHDAIGRTIEGRSATTDDIQIYLGTAPLIIFQSSKIFQFPRTEQSGAGLERLVGVLGADGAALQWFKNNFCNTEIENALKKDMSPYEILDEKAEKVEPGSAGIIFMPHMMGERAYLGRLVSDPNRENPYARGVMFGLCLGHRREHLYRAIMEGITYHLKLCWEQIQKKNPRPAKRILVFGGGAKSRCWRQIIADVFGLPVCMPKYIETGALAIARLISVALGVYENVYEADRKIRIPIVDTIYPREKYVEKYSEIFELYKELEKSLDRFFTSRLRGSGNSL